MKLIPPQYLHLTTTHNEPTLHLIPLRHTPHWVYMLGNTVILQKASHQNHTHPTLCFPTPQLHHPDLHLNTNHTLTWLNGETHHPIDTTPDPRTPKLQRFLEQYHTTTHHPIHTQHLTFTPEFHQLMLELHHTLPENFAFQWELISLKPNPNTLKGERVLWHHQSPDLTLITVAPKGTYHLPDETTQQFTHLLSDLSNPENWHTEQHNGTLRSHYLGNTPPQHQIHQLLQNLKREDPQQTPTAKIHKNGRLSLHLHHTIDPQDAACLHLNLTPKLQHTLHQSWQFLQNQPGITLQIPHQGHLQHLQPTTTDMNGMMLEDHKASPPQLTPITLHVTQTPTDTQPTVTAHSGLLHSNQIPITLFCGHLAPQGAENQSAEQESQQEAKQETKQESKQESMDLFPAKEVSGSNLLPAAQGKDMRNELHVPVEVVSEDASVHPEPPLPLPETPSNQPERVDVDLDPFHVEMTPFPAGMPMLADRAALEFMEGGN